MKPVGSCVVFTVARRASPGDRIPEFTLGALRAVEHQLLLRSVVDQVRLPALLVGRHPDGVAFLTLRDDGDCSALTERVDGAPRAGDSRQKLLPAILRCSERQVSTAEGAAGAASEATPALVVPDTGLGTENERGAAGHSAEPLAPSEQAL
jgi:hypothetical protein